MALALVARDGSVCWICGFKVEKVVTAPEDLLNNSLAASLDHVVPKSAGGTRRMENLWLAHRCCNMRRGNREVTEEVRRLCRPVLAMN